MDCVQRLRTADIEALKGNCMGEVGRHRAYIDALRGYAILIVIVVHTLVLNSDVWPLLSSQLLRGGFGVQLFFVVSALTLTQSWRERGDGTLAFFVRRLFRIAPMFWAAIIVFYYLPWPWGPFWNHENIRWGDMLLTAALAHGIHPLTFNAVVPGGWSIAVEAGFYLIFPLMMVLATSLRNALIILVVALASTWASTRLALFLFADSGATAPAQEYYATRWLPAQLPVFMCGVVIYYLIGASRLNHGGLRAKAILLSGLAVFLVLPYVPMPATAICSVYAIVFSVIAYGLAFGGGPWMVNPAICWLGKISFSAYFWHFAILSIESPTIFSFHGTFAFFACVLAVLVLTVVGSSITYLLIEEPMIRLGSRLASKLKNSRDASAQAQMLPTETFAVAGASVAKTNS
jgi:peptidoglycan/LPS O-acetylase OafA/YrhL